jgi:two-component system CheB/CheR fusion protein
MDPTDILVDENRRLRRTMRDMLALSSLPAIWIGTDLQGIGRSLADALFNTLSLDLVYLRLSPGAGLAEVEITRAKHFSDNNEAVLAALAPLLQPEAVERPTIADPIGPGQLHVATTRFGMDGDLGILVACSGRPDFPAENDQMLLRFAANQTTIVAQRRRAEASLHQSEEKLRLLANTIPQLAWMAKPDGHIFWFNRRCYEFTGLTIEQLDGWSWAKLLDPDVSEQVLAGWQGAIASGEPFDMVFSLKGADGHFCPFLTRVNPFKDDAGRILYWFGTNTDISDIKHMEEALRDADRRKDEFLATLAHELRNPLAPIRNGLHVMRLSGNESDTIAEARTMMERQVDQMVRLVDDLLDVSRITRNKLELRMLRIELSVVVQSAIETSRPLIEQGRHSLSVALPSEPVYLEGDAVRLAQVFSNLLNNSAKYTEPGGNISLTAELRPGEVWVRIKDNGLGIPADALPRIFEMFSQVDRNLERAQGGLGIGLTLVRSLVEMHGGAVAAHSDGPGQGSEFIVRLPMVEQEQADPESQVPGADSAEATQRRRILVVDDNRDSAISLGMMLKIMGNEIRTAHDGLAAIDAAAKFLPDIILLDIGLPKLNGYEACRLIREQPWSQGMMIVALTGWGQDEDRRRSAEAGFNHHLVKPVDIGVLQTLLAGSMEHVRASEGRGQQQVTAGRAS